MAFGKNGRNSDPGTRVILAELRDLRLEMRAERREDRRRADEDRRRAHGRFEQLLHEFRRDSARREAATQKAFRDIRAVGLSIVKTLNRHTRLLERIDGKLGAWRNGRPDSGNGRRA